MRAAFDLFALEFDKPSFDEVQPGRARRREVQMEPRALGEPALNQRGLMGAVVVEDQMHVQVARHVIFDEVQKPAKLSAAMPTKTPADDGARLGIERGEQRRCAIANVVVRSTLDLPRPHRQQGRRPVEGLDLALLIDAEHERAIRGIQIQAHNVADLLDEQRVFRQLERLAPMRLQGEGLPDPRHGCLTHAALLGQRARAPLRGITGGAFQRRRQDPLHVGVRDAPRGARLRLIEQALTAILDEALSPAADGRTRHPCVRGHLAIRASRRARQDNPRSQRERLGGRPTPRPLVERRALGVGQHEFGKRSATSSHQSTSLYL